jgi:hypothetical protein
MTSPVFTWASDCPPPSAPLSQVTAFFQVRLGEIGPNLEKRASLRKRGAVPIRHVLIDDDERQAKFAIETGYDVRTGTFLARGPLERWTCPWPELGKRIYQQIASRAPGADLLERYSGAPLECVLWLRDVQLAQIDDGIHIEMLSDVDRQPECKYPGAPCDDRRAAVGRQLRDRKIPLIMQAVAVLLFAEGKRADARRVPEGIRLAAREICYEANKIKARCPDLDEYRYLSVELVRKVVRDLIASGELTEMVAPRPARQDRTWVTIPRVYAPEVAPRWQRSTPPAPDSRASRRRRARC